MKKIDFQLKGIVVVILIIQIFNGLSALVGGIGLILHPDGVALGMDVDWLKTSPFSDFLIPGLILFFVNGIGNTAGAVLTYRKYGYAVHIAALFGLIMCIWIAAQVAWIGYGSILQIVYFASGALQYLTARHYLRRNLRFNS